jgi:tetratricopeptide (TPR) repeat protein
VADAIKILEEAVARDPGFAPAWGLLATAYHFQLLTHPAVLTGMIAEARPIVRVNLAKAEAAAQQAIKLDPKSVDGHFALGQSRNDAGDRLSAIDLWRQTLTLDPDYPDALQSYSILLTHMGFSKDAIPVRDHLLALEPLVPAFQGVTARVLFGGGQTDAAISILKGRPSPLLAQIYAAQGRYREAADVLENVQASFDPELAAKLGTAAKLLRAAPAAAPENDRPELGALNWVYFHAGAPERFLKTYEDKIRVGFAAGVENGLEWAPVYSSVRKTEQFKAYVRNAGILTYWRERGWPDLCKPVGADDFACE